MNRHKKVNFLYNSVSTGQAEEQRECTYIKSLIPAKGMLFGEYAVLQNYPAIAVTFFDEYFEIATKIEKSNKMHATHVVVHSSFFETGILSFIFQKEISLNSQFFNNLLLPWKEYLSGYDLTIDIMKSFPPNLGFGSSSAIIVGISLGLYGFFFNKKPKLNDNFLWSQLRKSLFLIQGSGSAYDIGVQLAATLQHEKKLSFWQFQNQENSGVPQINKLSVNHEEYSLFGCFLKTHLYSDTKKALSKFSNAATKNEFAKIQGEISKKVLIDLSLKNMKELMMEANLASQKFGLFPDDSSFHELLSALKGLTFKSMGAGYGDCLWVLASKKELISRGIKLTNIAFYFADT